MLGSPFHYDDWLTPEEFQKLGQLALRWSHIDHILGNCLNALLRFSDDEAVVMVFPLSTDARFQRIKEIAKLANLNAEAEAALDGLRSTLSYVQQVRNNVIHAILIDDPKDGQLFHLRSKGRTITKEQVFQVEELTNYVAHAALSLRYAIGMKGSPGERHPLPEKPEIPDFLQNPTPSEIRRGQQLPPRPGSSGG